jgi:rare lipoprotein A
LEVGVVLLLLLGLLSGCSSTADKGWATNDLPDPASIPDAVPKLEPKSKYGNPASYVVFGRRYYTRNSSKGYIERGVASWYGRHFHGRKTSSGERYDMYAMTAAHKTLPLPTYARVTNLTNGRTAVVKINDRGPFHGDRVIDLSYSAARKLGVVAKGTGMVEIRAIDPRHPESARQNLFLASSDRVLDAKAQAPKKVVMATRKPTRKKPTPPVEETEARVAKAEKPRGSDNEVPVQLAKTEKPQAITKEGPVQAAKVETSHATTQDVPLRVAEAAKPPRPEPKARLAEAGKTPRTASRSSMYLQVGAFGSRANAEHLRRRLARQIAERVEIRSIDDNTMHWYKVHVGPFESRKTAKDLSQQLASLGLAGSHIVVE